MKFPILILAVFGLACGKSIPGPCNNWNYCDILELIPVDQILSIAMDYLANDSQVQELVAYLQSAEFQKIVSTVEGLPEFKNYVGILNEHGLDIIEFINTINSLIGLPPYSQSKSDRRGVGVAGLLQDIIAVLPLDKLKALFDCKMQNSSDFKAVYDSFSGPEFQSIISALRAMPEYQAVLQKLKDCGVDVDIYIQAIRDFFGVSSGARNLQDDLNDFLALIPVDQILSIAMDYLASDSQAQEFVAYLQSPDFQKIVSTVEALPEFKSYFSFLLGHGLDITEYINTINSLIGLPPYSQGKRARRGVGVAGLLQDIIIILPPDPLKELFDEKMRTSPDFKAWYDSISGPEFQSIISALRAMPEYQALLQKLRDYGFDVDTYIQAIRDFFGVTSSARNLQDDLNDLLALIPVDQILSIATDYLANDSQVQELVAYLQSPNFQKIVSTVEALPEFKSYFNFILDHGLDITEYINTINSLIGLPPYSQSKSDRRGVGVNGLLQDIIAVLPLDKLKALFDDKMQNSSDFKAFYDSIRSAEFQSLISALSAMPEYQVLLQKLKDYGVDVDYYIQIFRSIFGVTPGHSYNPSRLVAAETHHPGTWS